MHPLVLVVGPTGSGKSDLGLSLAEEFGGAILNCDSLQTYKRLDIGTAKPSSEERARVPHHLFDTIEPGAVLTAGDYRRVALDVLARELPSRPVFGVGGSGFYIQALEKGMFDVGKPDPECESEVRAEADQLGLAAMFAKLAKADPEYADQISPNDSYRILRALIIIRDSGKSVTELKASFKVEKFPYPLLKLGLLPSREELLPRVEARARKMLASGLVAEVQALLNDGYEDWPPLQSVGYRETVAYLRGEIPEEKLLPLIVEKTMQLAKKQKTWFKRDTEIHWLPLATAVEEGRALLTRFRLLDSLK